VLQINFITKRRAFRYIAAAQLEWLYPEKRASSDHWKKLGDGFLLMPEPRLIVMGGETMIRYSSGHVDSYSEYGHKPWQKGFKDNERDRRDGDALYRFQAEWAMKYGPRYTAYNHEFGRGDLRRDSDDMMEHHHCCIFRSARWSSASWPNARKWRCISKAPAGPSM
jgi:hypothetical protein